MAGLQVEMELVITDVEDGTVQMEEATVPKHVRSPDQPTAKEILEHEATHVPYKPWCKFCIMGRALNDPHRRVSCEEANREKEENAVSTVSVDYAYLNEKLEIEDEERKKAGKP